MSCMGWRRRRSRQKNIKLLDLVASTESIPDRGLAQRQVGTVVEELADDVFEVEFCRTDRIVMPAKAGIQQKELSM